MLYYNFFFQDKEAQSRKSEEEKEAKEGSEPEGQEDPEGRDEEGSENQESETDYSSADENILTKAGRWSRGTVTNSNRKLESVRLSFVGCPVLFYIV